MGGQCFTEMIRDILDRIESTHRILHYHSYRCVPKPTMLLGRKAPDGQAPEDDPPSCLENTLRQQSHYRHGSHCLSRAAFSYQSYGSSGRHHKRKPIDYGDLSLGKDYPQIVDLQCR